MVQASRVDVNADLPNDHHEGLTLEQNLSYRQQILPHQSPPVV